MEIILNYGDKISVPQGCRAIIEDGVITIESDVTEFKDGDVLVSIFDGALVIFKEMEDDYHFCSYYNTTNSEVHNSGWNIHAFGFATEKEKQKLFNMMAEQNLRWNTEEKKVEKIRWRAEDGEEYCYVGNQGIIMVDKEDGHCVDKNRHEIGNYFRTREQAEKAAELVKETLRKFHE